MEPSPHVEGIAGDAGTGIDPVLLQRFLARADAPCPVCGYSLHQLTSDHCPECGATLELRVGSVDLKLGRWLAMVLTFALPFGLGSCR